MANSNDNKKRQAVNNISRNLPHNKEAEQSLLGCIILSQNAQIDIFGQLKPTDFYSESHKTLFEEMYELYSTNTPIDFVTLLDKLERKNILDSVGGINYVSLICDSMPSAANYKEYLEIVKRDSILRQLINASQTVIDDCYSSGDHVKTLEEAEKLIFDIAQGQDRSTLVHFGEALNNSIDRFDSIARDKGAFRGIPTGFHALDQYTNGFQNSDLILLAARPSVGKTAFAMNLVTNIALSAKKKCAVFSLEMSKEQLAQRALCSTARVSMEKALKGDLETHEWQAIWAAHKELAESGIYVDDSSLNTPIDILSKCRRLKREKGLDFIMIDYLQLMQSGDSRSSDSRQNEVASMSRYLKVLARELNIPVLVLSQLSRAVEKRNDHRPILSDLRESGAIEQDADIVMFLHRDKEENAKNPDQAFAELIIAKHRNGPLGTIKLLWVGANATYRSLDRDTNLQSIEDNMPPERTKKPAQEPKKEESNGPNLSNFVPTNPQDDAPPFDMDDEPIAPPFEPSVPQENPFGDELAPVDENVLDIFDTE